VPASIKNKKNGWAKSLELSKPLPSMPPAVDPTTLNAYIQRLHPGPTTDYMPISWKDSMGHPWNQKVIQMLVAEFNKKVKDCHYQLLTSLPDNNFTTNTIRNKLSRHQTMLNSSMRKMQQAGNLSASELAAVLTQEKDEARCKSRRNERRRNVSRFAPYF
jgi:hypothetical protein